MVKTCTAPCHINSLCILHREFNFSCESQSKSDYFPKRHSPNSLHSVDRVCSVWRKKRICMCSLNKPPALHSICVFDCPTEDAEFLCKFRIAVHAFHSALSKSFSKNFCQNSVFPTLSKCRSQSKSQNYFHCCIHVQFTSFAFCIPRGCTLSPALLYQKDEHVLPDGLQSNIFFSSSSCRKYNVSH